MIRLSAAALLLLAGGAPDETPEPATRFAQVTFQQRVVIRVPDRSRGGVPAMSGTTQWRETRGPRCISAREIAGANLSESSVDLIMRDNRRIRARLGRRCAGLNYYRGFYLESTADGRICAERDAIRSRMGGECGIAEFRALQPAAAGAARPAARPQHRPGPRQRR